MITAIEIENFKAIRDRVRIELKPITLLFGPNSAGKSSVIQALHYAREIFERANFNADRTVAGGVAIDLGGFANFVHGHDLRRGVSLRFDIDLQGVALPEYFDEPDIEDTGALSGLPSWDISDDINSAWLELKVEWSDTLRTPQVTEYDVGINGVRIAGIRASIDRRRVYLARFDSAHPLFVGAEDDYSPEAEARDELGMLCADVIRDLESREGSEIGVYRQLSALPNWGRPLDLRFPSWEEGRRATRFDAFHNLLSRLLVGVGDLVQDELNEFRYLGPLREVPPRSYEPPRSPDESRWATGLAAWDSLGPEGKSDPPQISRWLSRLKSGYELRVRRFKELDVDGPIATQLREERALDAEEIPGQLDALPLRWRVVLIEEGRDLEMLPRDVGVGISQLVPVVVLAVHPRPGLRVMEQPDLHLHPAIQVELGDLFIEAVSRDRTFLLETHSEHLLLRLLRRIRETSSDELPPGIPKLRPHQLSILYVEPSLEGARISPLRVDESGDFLDRWPRGFFEERIDEIL